MGQGTLVVGTITRDFVRSPAIALEGVMGGSASYFALAARHFGPVTVVAPVGRDVEQEARATLAFADLRALSVMDAPTYQWHARRETPSGDAETIRRFIGATDGYRPYLGHAETWAPVILLGSCDPVAQLDVAAAAPRGALLAADTMDIFIQEQRELVCRVLAASRILLATDLEIRLLAGGETDAPATLVMARFGLDCVVVKRGAGGADLWTRTAIYELPACPVEAIDPTGAGDALAGGFLGRLAQRLPGGDSPSLPSPDLVEALRWGIVCASFAVEHPGLGGLLGMTREALYDRMSRYELTLP